MADWLAHDSVRIDLYDVNIRKLPVKAKGQWTFALTGDPEIWSERRYASNEMGMSISPNDCKSGEIENLL